MATTAAQTNQLDARTHLGAGLNLAPAAAFLASLSLLIPLCPLRFSRELRQQAEWIFDHLVYKEFALAIGGRAIPLPASARPLALFTPVHASNGRQTADQLRPLVRRLKLPKNLVQIVT